MKYTAVIISFDNNYGLPGWITTYSLLKNANPETSYHVFIFITKETFNTTLKVEIEKLFFNTNHKLTLVEVTAESFTNVKIGWSDISTYFRLIVHEHILEYDFAIWTDVDVLIYDDLSSLMNYDITHTYWAGIQGEPNDPDYVFHGFYPENPNAFNYMLGIMVMNLKKCMMII